MKITVKELRQIIREEIQKNTLNEASTDLSKKYAKLPKNTMSLGSTIAADGKSPEIKTQVTYDFYRMKSKGVDLFMSRKQSKKIFKALEKGLETQVGADENENDDKFPAVQVKKDKDGMIISAGGKKIALTKKQAIEVAEDIETSFY